MRWWKRRRSTGVTSRSSNDGDVHDACPRWTTEPLTEAERADFRRRFDARLAKVKAKTADVFAFRDVKAPPYIVNSALYWVFGLDPDTLPDDYVTDPAVMINFQERTYYDQVKEIDDDFVPYLMPWYGTIVTASALGCQIEYFPKKDPAANPRFYPIQTAADVRRMQIADPERDGLMPRVLDYLRLMKAAQLPAGRHHRLPGAADHRQPAHGL